VSSHREAPEISKDPVADSTDLYAFVSPDAPTTVTLIANYLPLQKPDGGPNFFEFGDDVLYEINIDNDGDGEAEIVYQFKFKTTIMNPNTFLYNTGPIQAINSPSWNRVQTYTLTRVDHPGGHVTQLGTGLACPPCNIGPLSTPNYLALANAAINSVGTGVKVFAGQRAEGFYVDLGAIFDLGNLRPFDFLHNTFGLGGLPFSPTGDPGVNSTPTYNVHTLALQIPMNQLTANGQTPSDYTLASSVIGVWTSASRRKVRIFEGTPGNNLDTGPYVQVSRLGNPLFNEVVVPMSKKDYWNSTQPVNDSQFAKYVANPELSQLLPVLYNNPNPVFPHLAAYNAGSPNRADLVAILLTGIPTGVITFLPGFPNFQNSMGNVQSDMLRLNMAIPPTAPAHISNLGLLGLDPAGFPNGRRVFDDVVTIEIQAFAGATLPLVDGSFTADGAAGVVTPGLTANGSDLTARMTENYLSAFPYLGTPHSGWNAPDING